MKILFLGADNFSAVSLKSFYGKLKGSIQVDILTNQPGSQLEKMGKTLNLSRIHHCPARSVNMDEKKFYWKDYDVGIVSSFGLFIPSKIIEQLPLINIHPSLLPQWRGPAPIQFTILNGHCKTGVSIIDLHPKVIDAGAILAQESIEIDENSWYPEVETQLAEFGGQMAARVIDDFDTFWRNRREQEASNPNLLLKSRKITKMDGIVSFKSDDFTKIYRIIRALSHQIPIKTVDLIPNRTVFLEDFVFTLTAKEGTERTDCCNDKPFWYDKEAGAVIFLIENNKLIGVKNFKIDGKSQTFSAGSFYSNFLK